MFKDYLNRGIIKAGSPSKLAEIIGKDYKDIWKYRNGKHLPEVTTCYKLAIYLDIEPSEVVACVEIEKAKSEENKEFWKSFLSQLKQGTTLVVLLTSLGSIGHVDTVSAGETSYNSEHKASLYEVNKMVNSVFKKLERKLDLNKKSPFQGLLFYISTNYAE